MMRTLLAIFCAAAVMGGCASYDGRGLVPGRSTAAEVEALMGRPAQRLAGPDGSSLLYYPRGPVGRHAYVVTVGADGVLRGIEQRLAHAYIMKLMLGQTTTKDVHELFGPPGFVTYYPRQARHLWEYKWIDVEDKRVLWVQFSDDGILREVMNSHDHESDPPGSDLPGR